jgi:hypothetical protein
LKDKQNETRFSQIQEINVMKNYLMILSFLVITVFGCRAVSAQFPIKIPKLPKAEKPKKEEPKASDNSSSPNQTAPDDSSQADSNRSQSVQNNSAPAKSNKFERPVPTNNPLLLLETLEISLKQQDKYWKSPNQRYYSNWHPRVDFRLFYDNNERVRYTAEWFKPDGSLWYSESLEASESSDGTLLRSPYNGELFDKFSTDQIGAYGLKITNNKTKEVVFQSKFNVKKSVDTPGDATMKNAFQFFVDNDWHLAVGYAGIAADSWSRVELSPEIRLWFKDVPERKDLEARLFFGNQEITSTDDGGSIVDEMRRGDECVRGQEICRYALFSFIWDKFKFDNLGYMRQKFPGAVFTRDKPGEYTAKVFYKGVQVREAKFTIAPDGTMARNSFSNNIYPSLTLIPVKVMGTAEKWNPNSWKTGMFYGNPIAGFAVQ